MSPAPIAFDLLCTRCEYNLRGLDPIGQCPECGQFIITSVDQSIGRLEDRAPPRLRWFDKVCAVLAAIFGIGLIVTGILRLVAAVSAPFTLPPILGLLRAVCGYGILRCVHIAFRSGRRLPIAIHPPEATAPAKQNAERIDSE
jgi:hypothetical protein